MRRMASNPNTKKRVTMGRTAFTGLRPISW
jgi:hypothetical protein